MSMVHEIAEITAPRRAMPMQTITVEVRSVYGTLKAYPVCESARLFADIAGTKTLSRSTLNRVQDLGYAVVSTANADWSAVQ